MQRRGFEGDRPRWHDRRRAGWRVRGAIAWLAVSLLASVAAQARAAEHLARIAVLVGANQAPRGRQPLAFGHADAARMADVLASVGGFRSEDVYVLSDPAPGLVLGLLAEAVARLADKPHALIYFYYSGHADERALYPAGQPLPLAALRKTLDEAHVATKIGVVDACRGGGWTRAKGLVPEPPFEVRWPVGDSEGSVLIASSSGLESAHESDQLEGSFFTYHFAAGLRGAADANGNKEVTLTEAFEYAKERTIRDTARYTPEAQHPSYAVNLRGRRELVLANVEQSPSTLDVVETTGPLQIIHIDSGIALLELPAGPRHLRLAVPPGRYLIKRVDGKGNAVKEMSVRAGERNQIDEAELTLVGNTRLAVKSVEPAFVSRPALPPPDRSLRDAAEVGDLTKWGAVATAIVAVGAGALTFKFARDVVYYNDRLDAFRRVPCTASPTRLCDVSGAPAQPRTLEQEAFVDQESSDRKDFEKLERIGLAVTGVAALASGFLFWRWFHPGVAVPQERTSSRTSKRTSSLRIAPGAVAGGGRLVPGLTLAGGL